MAVMLVNDNDLSSTGIRWMDDADGIQSIEYPYSVLNHGYSVLSTVPYTQLRFIGPPTILMQGLEQIRWVDQAQYTV